MIDLKSYLTASGRYPEREKHLELTQELLDNAEKLLDKVNAFLLELGFKDVSVTSGFRPTGVNANTAGAAKKSNHTLCCAVDILDDKLQTLGKSITEKLLEKHGLYMEDLAHTKGTNTNWVHLSFKAPKSGKRIFIP